MQADTLTKIVGQLATKEDLDALEIRVDARLGSLESSLRAEIARATAEVKSELTSTIAETRGDLETAISEAQNQTMRWGITMIIAMASIFTLLDIFID